VVEEVAVTEGWGNIWSDDRPPNASWEDQLTKEERAGGPSPWGSSKWGLFERCPYLYSIHHVKRLRREEPSMPLEIGGLVHECLARYYNADMEDRSATECIEEMFELINRCRDTVPQVTTVAERLLKGWLTINGPGKPGDTRRSTAAVELLCETNDPVVGPYSTRFDRLIVAKDGGGIIIEDTKTASAYTESLVRGYQMDRQFIGMQHCYQASGLWRKYGKLVGFQVNLMVKTKTMQFYIEQVPVDPALLKAWRQDQAWLFADFVRCQAANYWPKKRTNCVMYGRRCEAHDICASNGKRTVGWVKKKRGEY